MSLFEGPDPHAASERAQAAAQARRTDARAAAAIDPVSQRFFMAMPQKVSKGPLREPARAKRPAASFTLRPAARAREKREKAERRKAKAAQRHRGGATKFVKKYLARKKTASRRDCARKTRGGGATQEKRGKLPRGACDNEGRLFSRRTPRRHDPAQIALSFRFQFVPQARHRGGGQSATGVQCAWRTERRAQKGASRTHDRFGARSLSPSLVREHETQSARREQRFGARAGPNGCAFAVECAGKGV